MSWSCAGGPQQRSDSSRAPHGYALLGETSRVHLTDVVSGYYNPMLAYGEDKAIQDAFEAGANGFIMVDLPPEEALTFREKCKKSKYVLMSLVNASPS